MKVNNATPVKISDVAKVYLGPATRRGLLDKGGAEAVGGVVVARYGANPMEVTSNIKAKIDLIETIGVFVKKGQAIATIYSPMLIQAQKEFLESAKIKNINSDLYQAFIEKLKQ